MTKTFGRTTTGQELVTWIHDNYPDRLDGRVAIVTGGYAGIGLCCTQALAGAGVQVVVPARNMAKATAALGGLPGVTIHPMDLMDPESIDDFATWFKASHDRLDYLIGCAGIMAPPLSRDSRGHESQFSTNHLGHFQLANRLAPLLAAADGHPRLVLVSSRAQRLAGPIDGINFDDLDWASTNYVPMLAYAASKTANVLTAVEFDRRWRDRGVRALAVHPGLIPGSDLGRNHVIPAPIHHLLGTNGGIGVADFIRRVALKVHGEGDLLKTPEQGAGTVLWTTLCPELDGQGGVYCEDCAVAPVVTDPKLPCGVSPWAVDPDKAKRLWQVSEQLLGGAPEAETGS